MASSLSTLDMQYGRDRQPPTFGSLQSHKHSQSSHLPGRPRCTKALTSKHDHFPGSLQEGEAVRVFSRSAAKWVIGEVVEFLEGKLVRVEYEVDENWCSKIMDLASKHFVIPLVMDYSSGRHHEHEMGERARNTWVDRITHCADGRKPLVFPSTIELTFDTEDSEEVDPGYIASMRGSRTSELNAKATSCKAQQSLIGTHLYELGPLLGSGSHGGVYQAIAIEASSLEVVVKTEPKDGNDVLTSESAVLRALQGPGIPKWLDYGQAGGHRMLVMERLGKSLEDLRQAWTQTHGKRVAWKEGMKGELGNGAVPQGIVYYLGRQIFQCIARIHQKGYIHCDIKPNNIMIGSASAGVNTVYMIDFGLSHAKQSDLQTEPKMSGFKGTKLYASINALLGFEQSRRDDYEAICYVLIELVLGQLPWPDEAAKIAPAQKGNNFWVDLMSKANVHPLLAELLDYAKGLKFNEEPDFAWIDHAFEEVLSSFPVAES